MTESDSVRDGANKVLDAIVERHRKNIEKYGMDEAEQLLVKTLMVKSRGDIKDMMETLIGRYALLMTRVAQEEGNE